MLGVVAVLLSGTVEAQGIDKGWKIAIGWDISGKNDQMGCLPFAKDLYRRFVKNGIEAHLIIFDWHARSGNRKGRHAYVVYRDGKGRYWGMDNVARMPRWLPGEEAKEWTSHFSRGDEIQVREVMTNKS